MEYDLDDINAYLSSHWRDDEHYTDINLMLDKGLIDLAAKTLIESGAIDSDMCYKNVQSIEKAIEELVSNYSKQQKETDLEEFWKNTTCWINESNEHYFINPDYHFVGDSELIEWGFRKN